MIKPLLHLLVIAFFLVSCSNSGKNYFTDKACDFEILFPGKPITSDRTIIFPFGSFSGKKFTYEATSGSNKAYSVTCIELPAHIVHSDSLNLLSELFALSQADYLKQFGEGALLNTYIKSINKYPGREFVWGSPQTNESYTRRVYYVRDKLYLLEVAYTTDNQHNLEIGSFLDSFHILSKEMNSKPEPTPRNPEKKFSIDFPGATRSKKQVVASTNGPQYAVAEMYEVNTSSHFDEFGNAGYGVNYMNYSNSDIIRMPEDMQKKFIYENSVKNPLILNGGKVISVNESTIDGTWCIELKALALGGRIELKAKSFFKNHYLYQIMVLSIPNKSENDASRRFMESFHAK